MLLAVGLTYASRALSQRLPTASLMNWKPICSILLNIFLMAIFQIFIYLNLQQQKWYSVHLCNKIVNKLDLLQMYP